MTHHSNGTGDPSPVETSEADSDRPARTCSPVRRACDREVADMFAELLRARREAGDASTSDSILADRLDFGSTTSVVRLREGKVPLHLGDLLALPRSLAREMLRAIEARLDSASPPVDVREHALRVSRDEGDLSRAVLEAHVDGAVDDREQRAIARSALKVAEGALALARDASPASIRARGDGR